MPSIENALSYLGAVLTVAVLFRLWSESLTKLYSAFAALLVFDLVATAILWATPFHSDSYAQVWMGAEAVKLLLYAMVALELCDVALRHYEGIRRAGRIAMRVCLAVAAALTILSLEVTIGSFPTILSKGLFRNFLTVEHSVILALAVFQVLMLSFLAWFPIRMTKNGRLYATLYILFFAGKAGALLVAILSGKAETRLMSTAILALYCTCLAAWALLLKKSGEDEETNGPLLWKRTDAVGLTEKLEALNERLSKAGKKQ